MGFQVSADEEEVVGRDVVGSVADLMLGLKLMPRSGVVRP